MVRFTHSTGSSIEIRQARDPRQQGDVPSHATEPATVRESAFFRSPGVYAWEEEQRGDPSLSAPSGALVCVAPDEF